MQMIGKSQLHTKKKAAKSAGSSPREKPAGLSEPNIVRYTREEIEALGPGQTDWERVANLTDEEIAAAVAGDPDAVPIDLDWSDAEWVIPVRKQPVSIRLDEDVLAFFKETGPRYQTRINEVLRRFMKRQLEKKA